MIKATETPTTPARRGRKPNAVKEAEALAQAKAQAKAQAQAASPPEVAQEAPKRRGRKPRALIEAEAQAAQAALGAGDASDNGTSAPSSPSRAATRTPRTGGTLQLPGDAGDRPEAREKGTGNSASAEPKEYAEPRDGREPRESRENRENFEPRDTGDFRQNRQVRDRDPNENRENRQFRFNRDTKDVRDTRDGRDGRDNRPGGGAGNQGGSYSSGGYSSGGGGYSSGGNYNQGSNYNQGGGYAQSGGYNQGGYNQRPQRYYERSQRDRVTIENPGLTLADLETRSLDELQDMAKELDISGYSRLKKQELAFRILQAQTEQQGNIFKKGILEIMEDGFGFMRLSGGYLPSSEDVYVSQSQIRRFGLRTGDQVVGQVRPPKESEKYYSLLRVEAVNGQDAETAKKRPNFGDLTPVFPKQMFDLETTPQILSTRLLNIVAPIGRGQRGLIVSPPKAGKTMLLKSIANGISANYGNEVHLMVALIGERPEEVTDMKRSVKGEVIASTFDEPVEDHTKVAEMTLERAKRLVEAGRDVVILLDSITRLARAYNLQMPPSGKTLSGGMDPTALYPPKAFFGAARNIEEGGSLTVIATCLVDTGSRMDDVVYEEFKGTGNMELHLDRKLSEKRVFPSIDIQKSGTRREELLMDENMLKQVWTMRRMVSVLGGTEGLELMLARLSKTKDNNEFLSTLTRDVL